MCLVFTAACICQHLREIQVLLISDILNGKPWHPKNITCHFHSILPPSVSGQHDVVPVLPVALMIFRTTQAEASSHPNPMPSLN